MGTRVGQLLAGAYDMLMSAISGPNGILFNWVTGTSPSLATNGVVDGSSGPYVAGNLLAGTLLGAGTGAGAEQSLGDIGTVTRYVGPIEAQIANETGYIPNVDQFGVPKDVYVTPEAPVATPGEASSTYQIQTPTHVIVGDASGISFNYGGNVAGGTGIEMTTTSQIPVISVTPFAAPTTPLVPPLTLVPTN